MSDNLSSLIRQWSQQIQTNKVSGLSQEIQKACSSYSTTPKQVTEIAGLLRRLGHSHRGAKLLRNILFLDSQLKSSIDPAALVEYAACLSRCGVRTEALRWLTHPLCSGRSDALLQAGSAEITNWNYQGALGFLERALSAPGITPYQTLVTRSNILACRLFLSAPSLDQDLSQMIRETDHQEFNLLNQNLRLLQVEHLAHGGRYDELNQTLKRLSTRSNPGTEHFQLQLRKWQAVSIAASQPDEAQNQLREIIELAILAGYWELRRDCLYFIAIISANLDLLRWLHRTTPFQIYKARIEKSPHFEPYSNQTIFLGREGSLRLPEDFQPLRIRDQIDFSDAESRVFQSLLCDALRPLSLSEIFGLAFSDEAYLPGFSDRRILRILERIKARLLEFEVHGLIQVQKRFIRVQTTDSKTAVQLVNHEDLPNCRLPPRFTLLMELLGPQSEFNLIELERQLGLSNPSAKRLAAQWQGQGLIQGIGSNRHRRYRRIA